MPVRRQVPPRRCVDHACPFRDGGRGFVPDSVLQRQAFPNTRRNQVSFLPATRFRW